MRLIDACEDIVKTLAITRHTKDGGINIRRRPFPQFDGVDYRKELTYDELFANIFDQKPETMNV